MINITYIYLIENIDNDPYKVYIGKSKNPKLRKQEHKRVYGSQIIFNEIDSINSLDRNKWRPIETMWIQTFISWGYYVVNTRKEGGSGPSFHNSEICQKMSESIINSKHKDLLDIDIIYSSKYNKVKNQLIEWENK
jgi:hypothetical protein